MWMLVPVYTKHQHRQLCDTVLFENKGVTPEFGYNPILEGLYDFQWKQYR